MILNFILGLSFLDLSLQSPDPDNSEILHNLLFLTIGVISREWRWGGGRTHTMYIFLTILP